MTMSEALDYVLFLISCAAFGAGGTAFKLAKEDSEMIVAALFIIASAMLAIAART